MSAALLVNERRFAITEIRLRNRRIEMIAFYVLKPDEDKVTVHPADPVVVLDESGAEVTKLRLLIDAPHTASWGSADRTVGRPPTMTIIQPVALDIVGKAAW